MKKIIFLLLLINNLSAKNFTLPMRGEVFVSVSRIDTGFNESPEALVYEKGKWSKSHRSTHNAFVIRHPFGDYLIDTGLGSEIEKQFSKMPFWAKIFFSYEQTLNITKAYRERPKGVILTHMHWDHTSALEEFLDSEVIVDKNEHEGAFSKDRAKHAFLSEQYDDPKLKWSFVDWSDQEFGPFAKFKDLFGDGSVILLPLYGHSKGSIGILVRVSKEKRLFFVGDSVWHADQVYSKKHKMALSSCLTDEDKEMTFKTIELLNSVWKSNKDIRILPAHHFEAIKFIPSYPQFL